MFRPSYLREGPGIDKDAPPKTGLTLVAEIFAREFWQIVKVNFLFLVCALPVVTFGAARAAMARCTVNMVRDIPNDVWTDFRRAIRQDFARNTLFGLAELALLVLGFALLHMAAVLGSFLPAVLGLLLLGVTAAFFQNFWTIAASLDLPAGAAAKNAWLLSLLRPGHTAAGLAAGAVIVLPCLLFFPLLLPVCLLLPFGLESFVSSLLCWSGCKRYLIRSDQP